jgi:hypothetical protein
MEPYAVVRRQGLPPYHEAFRGWGLNKLSWYWRLGKIEKYKFGVLQDFFVSHLHHPMASKQSLNKEISRNGPVFAEYKKDLQSGFFSKTRTSEQGKPIMPQAGGLVTEFRTAALCFYCSVLLIVIWDSTKYNFDWLNTINNKYK